METKTENTTHCDDDVIIIECGNEIPKPISETKTKTLKKPSRKVSLDLRENNSETLIITQKVKLTHKIKYIINLNNNVSDSNVMIADEQSPTLLSSKIERSVPKCSRRKCQYVLKLENLSFSSDRGRSTRVTKQRTHNTKSEIKSEHKHSRNKILRKKEQRVIIDDNLSPISLSPISYSDISYENISSDSFSDTDLDTLIKRSKERERINSQPAQSSSSFSDLMYCSNSPQSIINLSSDSDTDILEEDKNMLILKPTCDLKIHALCPTENIGSKSIRLEELKN